jgi:hypothetical protein
MTIAAGISVLSAASAIALDIRPDKNLADVTATNQDESPKSLEAELARPTCGERKSAWKKRASG